MEYSNTLIAAAAAGFFSHIGFFIKGEHHNEAAKIMNVYLLLTATLVLIESLLPGVPLGFTTVAMIVAAYAGALFSSMTVYRIFFHRLRKFPGPPVAAISKLWHVSKILDSKQYLMLDKLRESYGDFVRTGPTELTLFHPDAVNAVHGPNSPCTKAAWYDHLLPLLSLGSTRAKGVHDERRRALNPMFTVKAMTDYEAQVWVFARQLESAISDNASSTRTIAAHRWFSFFAFDLIGDFLFGKPLGMLKSGKSHYAVDLLKQGVEIIGLLAPVPWLFRIAASLPGAAKDWLVFTKFALEQLQGPPKAHQTGKPGDDSTNRLKDTLGRVQWNEKWAHGDCVTLILAGSGEIASTLTFIFYHLAQHPAQARKLQAELDTLDSNLNAGSLRSLDHLNAIISGTLRLHPPILSGSYRNTPPEGIEIAGQHIPGDITVNVPAYSLHRLESCFLRPREFIPERWSTQPELVVNKNAYFPFISGTYVCLGKQLALMELRIVTSLLVSKYDVRFVDGDEGSGLERDTKDAFAAVPGEFDLIFQRRS